MAKRSSGNGLWLLVAVIILIAAVPREVWNGFGVLAGLGVLAYLIVKHVRLQPAIRTLLEAPVDDAPTLAKLTRATPSIQSPRAPQSTRSSHVPLQAAPARDRRLPRLSPHRRRRTRSIAHPVAHRKRRGH